MLERFLNLLGYERRSLAYPSPELLALFGPTPNASGVAVNSSTALNSPTLLACCRAIVETVSTLPIHLYERKSDGSRERVTDHPVSRLLAGDWTPWQSGTEARAAIQLDALTSERGYGVAQVVRAGGRPRELHRLPASAVQMEVNETTGEPSFKVKMKQGGDRPLPFTDVIFIPVPGWTPDRPISLVQRASLAIGLEISMQERQARLFGNAPSTGGKLKLPPTIGEQKAKELLKAFVKAHAGPQKAGGILTLWGGMEFEDAKPVNLLDQQFLELRKFLVAEIARVYRVPLPLVGDLDRAVWKNLEQLAQQYLTHCILPWLEMWKGSLERVLLTPKERETFYLEFVTEDLLRADIAARFEALNKAIGGAWMAPNEGRALENLPPKDGGDDLIRQAGQSDASKPAPVRSVA